MVFVGGRGEGKLHTKALTYPNITILLLFYWIIMWRNPHLPRLALKPDSSIVSALILVNN
jgi:hypothetical protein